MSIEVIHVVGFVGENHVETRCPGSRRGGSWTELGRRNRGADVPCGPPTPTRLIAASGLDSLPSCPWTGKP